MPFFWITTSLILGILCARIFPIHVQVWAATCLIIGFCFITLFVMGRRYSIPYVKKLLSFRLPHTRLSYLFLLIFFLMGGWIYQSNQPGNHPGIIQYNDLKKTVSVSGKVIEPVDLREKLSLVKVQVQSYSLAEGPDLASQEILEVFLQPGVDLTYGDIIHLTGNPVTPSENDDFSYKEYLAGQKIYSIFYYPHLEVISPASSIDPLYHLFQFKEKSLSLLDQLFPMPDSALVKGILLGDDSDIPDEVYAAFRNSGTTHLIAISGFNIALVSSLVVFLFGKLLGKWRGTAFAIVMIGCYTILVGASPSVVRAAIMGSISMLGVLIGRKSGGVNAVFLTAGIMLLVNPILLWSISFQLSVSATLGLVLYASFFHEKTLEFLSKYFPDKIAAKIGGYFSEYVLYTLAAQIPTFPLLLYHFHNLPLATFVSNPLVLPFQPFLMIFSGLALLVSWVSLPLAKIIAIAGLPFVSITIKIVEWASGLNWPGISTMRVSASAAIVWIFLCCLPAVIPEVQKFLLHSLKPAFLFTGLLIASSVLMQASLDQPDGYFTIVIMGGNRTGAVYLQTPSGNQILINGGSSSSRLLAFLDPHLPVFHRSLDLVLLTDSTRNHAAVADLLPIIPARSVLIYQKSPANPVDTQTWRMVPYKLFSESQTIQLEEDISLRLYSPQPSFTSFQVEYGDLVFRWLTSVSNENDMCGANLIITEEVLDNESACRPQILVSRNSTGSEDFSLDRMAGMIIRSDGQRVWMEYY